MNIMRTYTSRQLATLMGVDLEARNFATPVLRLADRIGIEHHGRRIEWGMPEAVGILVAHRTAPGAHTGMQTKHDVLAARACIAMMHRGYVPRWVLWSPSTGYVRASPLKLEALWPRVPRTALEAGMKVLSLDELLAELEGVS
jgi:hypothetical protein